MAFRLTWPAIMEIQPPNAGVTISNLLVQCGCGRTMTPVLRHGPTAFRCGCGALVKKIEPSVAGPREARIKRCVAGTEDEPCGRAVCKQPGFEWLCLTHYEDLLDRAFKLIELDDVVTNGRRHRFYAEYFTATEEEFNGTARDAERLLDKYEAARRAKATTLDVVQWLRRFGRSESVVYYAELGSLIKIGTSVDAPRRMRELALPDHALKATEPGGLGLESERHEQFAEYHAHGEWFHPGPRLVSHIEALQTPQQRKENPMRSWEPAP